MVARALFSGFPLPSCFPKAFLMPASSSTTLTAPPAAAHSTALSSCSWGSASEAQLPPQPIQSTALQAAQLTCAYGPRTLNAYDAARPGAHHRLESLSPKIPVSFSSMEPWMQTVSTVLQGAPEMLLGWYNRELAAVRELFAMGWELGG